MKTALVTGSDGFVGRHMVRELKSRDYEVDCLDVASSKFQDVRTALPGPLIRYDLVVHCAYIVGGRKAIDGSPMNLATNLSIDAALFDWAVRTKQHRLLYFSSSAAYPVIHQTSTAQTVLHEQDLVLDLSFVGTPDANYGWAKVTGEQLARAASNEGLPVHIVRPFSGYGEDQDLTYPFPAFVARAKSKADPFEIWGNADQVRDWIHIDDVVHGALAVVDADYRRPVNLSTGIATSMRQLATMVTQAAGYSPEFQVNPKAPMGVFYRVGDPTRFNEFYTPKITIEEGVARAFSA